MWDADQFDRRHIPDGICIAQNAIGFPKIRLSTFAA